MSASTVARRCTQRQFLLRPDAEMNNAFVYCLAVAAQRHPVEVMVFIQQSNHMHESVFDRERNLPAFYEHFHKLLAKCVNVLRGRWENVFASGQTSVVRILTREALIEQLAYVVANPVLDGLVERVDHWPGASGYRALLEGRPLTARRPRHFFAEDGDMPEEVELHLTIPPELGDRGEILKALEARVTAIEVEEAARRARDGVRVLGRYAVLRQSWRESPKSREPRRGLRPTVAGRNLAARLDALQRKREFTEKYRIAWLAYCAGRPAVFPAGTYLMHRYFGVAVEVPAEPMPTFADFENSI